MKYHKQIVYTLPHLILETFLSQEMPVFVTVTRHCFRDSQDIFLIIRFNTFNVTCVNRSH